jgi:hypothetical protein
MSHPRMLPDGKTTIKAPPNIRSISLQTSAGSWHGHSPGTSTGPETSAAATTGGSRSSLKCPSRPAYKAPARTTGGTSPPSGTPSNTGERRKHWRE